ncbi:hypothetical protein [Desulfovibrio sp. 1214_IL3152]|uniref:hypothetical protein n=1 Tax=Desulfovibrio sp. 1214_IL3152 TaxID=3084056 RepID=UPI002FD8B6C4
MYARTGAADGFLSEVHNIPYGILARASLPEPLCQNSLAKICLPGIENVSNQQYCLKTLPIKNSSAVYPRG